MNILFVIPTLGTGGAEHVATILANCLVINHKIDFLVMEESSVERYPINPHVHVHEIGVVVTRGNKVRAILTFGLNFIKQRKALLHWINTIKPDVVISFLPKADILVSSIKKSGQFKWISSERNDPMSRSSIERRVLNILYKKTDMLVCQTKKVAKYYKEQGVRKVCVIRNPVIIENQINLDFRLPYQYLISVGRLAKQKNYEMLIDAFSDVKRKTRCPEKLLILGDGPEREKLQALIEKLDITKDVLLVGRKKNVMDYLRNAEAFVMSSNYEGLPNALIEAMAARLPVVSTDFFTGAAAELIDDKNGYLVPVGDKEKMKETIEKIVSLPSNVKITMGHESAKKIKDMDVNIICNSWNKLLSTTYAEELHEFTNKKNKR